MGLFGHTPVDDLEAARKDIEGSIDKLKQILFKLHKLKAEEITLLDHLKKIFNTFIHIKQGIISGEISHADAAPIALNGKWFLKFARQAHINDVPLVKSEQEDILAVFFAEPEKGRENDVVSLVGYANKKMRSDQERGRVIDILDKYVLRALDLYLRHLEQQMQDLETATQAFESQRQTLQLLLKKVG